MAGYNYERSMSNNAVAAEASGELTCKQVAKQLKVSQGWVEKYLPISATHHQGESYAVRDVTYYSPHVVAALTGSLFAIRDAWSEYLNEIVKDKARRRMRMLLEAREEYPQELERRREMRRKKTARTITAVSVKWLSWEGYKPTGKYNRPTEHSAENVQVTLKGNMATLHLPDGDVRKQIDSNGFELIEVA